MDVDTAFGKMCQERSVPIGELTLPTFLDLWSAGAFLFLSTDGRVEELPSTQMEAESLNTVCLTLSTSESPNDVVESSLSSTLESGGVDSRYYLSRVAAIGILRRASTRGKELPLELKSALINRAKDGIYGEKDIADASKVLRILWEEVGENAFKSWISRVIVLVQSEEILLSQLFFESKHQSTNNGEKRETASTENDPDFLLSRMWEDWENSSPSYRQKPSKQLKEKLDSSLLELSRKEASEESLMRCLWAASEGSQSMHKALASMAEIKPEGMGYSIYSGVEESSESSKRIIAPTLTASNNPSRSPQSSEVTQQIFAVMKAIAIRTAQTGANGIGVAKDVSHTLDGANGQAVMYENHANDSRVTRCEDGIAPTLSSRMGTGGGNVPLVLDEDIKQQGGGYTQTR